MNILFTADNHFGHEAQIVYSNRPFKSLKEHDTTQINNWNQRVKNDDLVFVDGDFVFCKSGEAPNAPKKAFEHYNSRLNGNKIFLKGSHDKQNGVKTIIKSMVIAYGGHSIWITHDPKNANPNYQLNFVGHVHLSWKFKQLAKNSFMINIGVDQWAFQPVYINEILAEFNLWRKQTQ